MRQRRALRPERLALVDRALSELGAARSSPRRASTWSTCRAQPLFERARRTASRSPCAAASSPRTASCSSRARCRTATRSATRTSRPALKLGEALEAFAENTMSAHPRRAGAARRATSTCRSSTTRFRDRPCLVVVRGVDHQKDLRILRPYVRDQQPVLMAVDGGADAILERGPQAGHDRRRHGLGHRRARCARGAELVVHAYPDGRAPGRDRLDRLEPALQGRARRPATSEDVAMLMAAEKGAELIVSVGSHFNLSSSSTRTARACRRRS